MAARFRLRGVKSSLPTQIDTFYATTKQGKIKPFFSFFPSAFKRTIFGRA